MQRATSTENLKKRSNVNVTFGTNNFDTWVDSLIDKIKFATVLDVCCGTGNQLLKYASRINPLNIVGIDISKKSLQTADKRLQSVGAGGYKLKLVSMEKMFEDVDIRTTKFDLISCFYGLYYSRDVSKTIIQMIDHLSKNGTLLIVGPYGKNNANLFEIVQRYFSLPEMVKRSSTTFMEYEVFLVLSKKLEVVVETFVNPVCFPDAKLVIDYWRASTFYSALHKESVAKAIKEHFKKYGTFIVEKHIMAYIAKRKL